MSAPTPATKTGKKAHVPLSPDALMKAIDSPAGSDPMPVEHHEFPMRYPELINSAVTEFMSLIYSKTIRRGHRCPRAVDGAGKLFTIEHVAEDRGWSTDWAMRVFNEAIRRGLVRRGRGGKHDTPHAAIVLCGRVKPQIEKDLDSCRIPTGTECTLRKLRTLLSENEYVQYEQMEPEARARFEQEELAEAEIDKRIAADAAYLARQLNNQRHSNRLLRYGIQPDAPAPKRRTEAPILQLQLVVAKERSVHSENGSGAHTPSNGSVHSDLSLLSSPSVYLPSLIRAAAAPNGASVTEQETASPPEVKTPPPLPDSDSKQNGNEPDLFEPVVDLILKLDPTATEVDAATYIAKCKEAAHIGLRPGDLLELTCHFAKKLSDDVRSAYAVLVKKVPQFIASRKAFEKWLENPNAPPLRFASANGSDDRIKRFLEGD